MVPAGTPTVAASCTGTQFQRPSILDLVWAHRQYNSLKLELVNGRPPITNLIHSHLNRKGFSIYPGKNVWGFWGLSIRHGRHWQCPDLPWWPPLLLLVMALVTHRGGTVPWEDKGIHYNDRTLRGDPGLQYPTLHRPVHTTDNNRWDTPPV